jgi:hypothetical protein
MVRKAETFPPVTMGIHGSASVLGPEQGGNENRAEKPKRDVLNRCPVRVHGSCLCTGRLSCRGGADAMITSRLQIRKVCTCRSRVPEPGAAQPVGRAGAGLTRGDNAYRRATGRDGRYRLV